MAARLRKRRPKSQPENPVRNQGKEYLELRGFHVWRQNVAKGWFIPWEGPGSKPNIAKARWMEFGKSGQSDLMAIFPANSKCPGRFLGAEAKHGKKTLSEDQEIFRDDVEACGGLFVEFRTLEELMAAVDPLL